jgi:1-acyl-sn-glycerol-3-phosphate acyltransferase
VHSLKKNKLYTNKITRFYRISRVVTHTLLGLLTVTLIFPVAGKYFKLRLIKWWCHHLLGIFNVGVILYGNSPPAYKTASNNLMIANHISWVDIYAINSILPIRFVAKSDIRTWPVFGYLASKAYVLFIERGKRHHAARIVDIVALSLKAGDNLCLFPEGTTTDGTLIMPFKGSLIQSAIEAQSTIWPVAIRYPRHDGSTNTEVAYAGDTTLLQSMKQVLLQKRPIVELHFLAPISTSALANEDKDRRTLTLHIQSLITKKLSL